MGSFNVLCDIKVREMKPNLRATLETSEIGME
jgi:hypothetical protein